MWEFYLSPPKMGFELSNFTFSTDTKLKLIIAILIIENQSTKKGILFYNNLQIRIDSQLEL